MAAKGHPVLGACMTKERDKEGVTRVSQKA